MKRSFGTLFVASAIFVLAACAPDDDQVDVREADEVQAPAPVMPDDTVMMEDTLHMHHDTVPQQ
jgi:hypothetical protein